MFHYNLSIGTTQVQYVTYSTFLHHNENKVCPWNQFEVRLQKHIHIKDHHWMQLNSTAFFLFEVEHILSSLVFSSLHPFFHGFILPLLFSFYSSILKSLRSFLFRFFLFQCFRSYPQPLKSLWSLLFRFLISVLFMPKPIFWSLCNLCYPVVQI